KSRIAPVATKKKRPPEGGLFRSRWINRSARVELDDQVRLHVDRIRHVGETRNALELGGHLVMIDLDIFRHIALGELAGLKDHGQLTRSFLDLDQIADLRLEGRDVDATAVDLDVTVRNELARGEHGRDELGAIDDRVQTALEEADQVLGRIALAA